MKFYVVSSRNIEGHADPRIAFKIKGLVYAHGLSIRRSEHGHPDHRLAVKGHLCDVGRRHNGKNNGGEVRVGARVKLVANAIVIAIRKTVAVAVIPVLSERTRPIVVCGFGTVVASAQVSAACNFKGVADAVFVDIRKAVACAVVFGFGEFT